jgi:hypothetical protein
MPLPTPARATPPVAEPAPFQALQYRFAAHLRDPEHRPMPEGLEERRVKIYRELFYNNVEGLIAGNFPVIRTLLPDAQWHALVRGFLADHQSHTPLFTEIGREFIRYLEARQERDAGDPPFLRELAHYEWVELALSIDEARIEDLPHDPRGDLLQGVPLPSPVAWPLVYRFPVHRIRPDFQPDTAPEQPTCLIVVRHRDEQVGFMEADPATIQLLEIMKANPAWTGLECLDAVAALFPPEAREQVLGAGAGMLRALLARDVILGTRA